ncbi:MAG: glycosyltransferase [Atopobiaceae bacterium]|nr:glycosyltransferase [Atopobiaceae bacterium]
MQDIDVTVVVPCYNTADFLDQCLSSIEQNDRCSIEVLVLNDGSTDDSLEIMRAHEAKDPRVRVIDKPNQGYGTSVNRGFDEAKGTYLAIVEPDDYLLPHMYDDMIDYARSFDELPDVVKTPYVRVVLPTTPKERTFHCAYYDRIKVPQPFTLKDVPRLIQHHPSIWSAIYRRDFINEKKIRFMQVPGAGWVDNPFLVETLCQAKSIVFLNKEYYCYREDLPGSSSMLKRSGLAFERWNDMTDVLERLGVTDPGILESHYVRGFAYLAGVMEEANVNKGESRELMSHMFSRMVPEYVLECPNISNPRKKVFLRVIGREDMKFSRQPYRAALVDEFLYSLRTNGLYFATSRVWWFVLRRARVKVHNPTISASAGI